MRESWLFLALSASLWSCHSQERRGTMLHFDFANREVKYVNEDLQEISGIFYLEDEHRMVSINDEDGKLFLVDFSGKTATVSEDFGKHGDYEDVTADDRYYYVLQSKGRIHRVRRDSVQGTEEIFDIKHKDSDFEAMYMDSPEKRIVMICKSCRGKEKKGKIPAFSFDLATLQFEDEPRFEFDTHKVKSLVRDKYMDCKPSAAAIHPILRKLFVLCSVGKVLVICDLNGKVEEAFRLDPSFFPQPEGITFSANGDMYISNEGQSDRGTIIRFPFVAP